MTIEFKPSFYGQDLIIEADNVKIVEDIEKRTWSKDENGKSFCSDRDISEEGLYMISRVLEDMIYYRKKEFDSSNLIVQLFDKLPDTSKEILVNSLIKDHGIKI